MEKTPEQMSLDSPCPSPEQEPRKTTGSARLVCLHKEKPKTFCFTRYCAFVSFFCVAVAYILYLPKPHTSQRSMHDTLVQGRHLPQAPETDWWLPGRKHTYAREVYMEALVVDAAVEV